MNEPTPNIGEHTKTVIAKIVSKNELDIYLVAESHDIAPKVISYESFGQNYKLTTEKYSRL